MSSLQEPASVLADELQAMLDLLGRSKDADVVALLIASNEGEPTTADHIAGVPGVASTAALGIVLNWFLTLVKKFLENGADKAAERAGEKAAEWISERLSRSKKSAGYSVSDRLRTVAEITKALEKAGWPNELVQKTADELWDRSEVAARRLSAQEST